MLSVAMKALFYVSDVSDKGYSHGGLGPPRGCWARKTKQKHHESVWRWEVEAGAEREEGRVRLHRPVAAWLRFIRKTIAINR